MCGSVSRLSSAPVERASRRKSIFGLFLIAGTLGIVEWSSTQAIPVSTKSRSVPGGQLEQLDIMPDGKVLRREARKRRIENAKHAE